MALNIWRGIWGIEKRSPFSNNSHPKYCKAQKALLKMRMNRKDTDWLRKAFPSLLYDQDNQIIAGELDFYAYWDQQRGELIFEKPVNNESLGGPIICDVFDIIILIEPNQDGWPIVYETGKRSKKISIEQGLAMADLHFNTDNSCCLGINLDPLSSRITIQDFLHELVIPFFYRLAYVDRFGLQAARGDLWGEYSHGQNGLHEYVYEMLKIKNLNVGRNEPCPCGKGKKYKRCHLYEVEATISRVKSSANRYGVEVPSVTPPESRRAK